MIILWWLIVGHAFADYVFQSDFIAKHKNRNVKSAPPPGQKQQIVWPYVLTSHALVHGAMVAHFTGSVCLGLAESISHWLIDFGKCENKYGIHLDQGMHIFCKIIWAIIYFRFL